MSAEIIILIIGAFFVFLALVDSIKIKGSSLGLLNTRLRIPLGIIGILLLIYGGYSYETAPLPGQIEQATIGNVKQVTYPIETVQVLSPLEGDSVSCRILTTGVYPDAHDKDIWVVLRPSDNKYYPQSDHTNTSFKRNGEWQVITRFGGDKAEAYDIIIYETDQVASDFFSSTIASWKEIGSYPGLEEGEIPSSVVEVDRIVVSLIENCRGVF